MSMQLNVTVNPVFNSSVFTAAGSKAGANFASGLNSSIGKSQPLGRITGQVSEFQKSIEAANARVLAFGASAGSIYVIKNAFDKLISSTIEVEKSITEINSVLGLGGTLIKNFSNEIFKAASLTGQTFETASKVALEFSRQGAGAAETAKRMTAALQLMRVSGLSADDSVNSITASLNAFSQEGLTAEEVVNRLAAVDMKFAVSSRDLANAIQRVGSVASDAGVQFNELLGLVTAAQTITARGGSVIGNAFKSIFTRLARPQVLDDLKAVGIETRDASGQILPMITVLKNLAKQYDSLAPSQKSFVAESVGGVYQINILKAALMDLGSGLSIFDRATLTASQSAGMMEERMEELNNTISSKLNASANELMRLFANIGQLTIGSSMKGALDDVAKNISFINNLLSEVEPDDSVGEKIVKTFSRGIMKGLGGIVSGPGVMILASLLTKVFADIGKFAIQSSKEFLGMNDALNKQKDIVNSIQVFLSQNPKILDAIKSGQLNINDAHLIYLKQLQQENKLKEENLTIATTMAGKAAPYITASKPKNAASGFVPNFAETEAQAERRMAISHGYSPGPVFKTLIHDGRGGASLSTVNGAEKIKTVTNEKGYKATFVVPPNGFGKNTLFAAKGFIPNFAQANLPTKNNPIHLSGDIEVEDGDTIKADSIIYHSRRGYRLSKVDAVEKKQTFGDKAAKLLQDRIGNKDSFFEKINQNGKATYDRGLFTHEQVAKELIDQGLGVPDIRYTGDYRTETEAAKNKNIGIWGIKDKKGRLTHPKAIQYNEQINIEDVYKNAESDLEKQKSKAFHKTAQKGRRKFDVKANGFIPNFAEQIGPPNPQGKISDAAIIAGSFQQVWDKKISDALVKEAERKIKAGIKKGTPTTEEANLRTRYEEIAGTALTNYLESSPELAYTKILQRFHTNTLPGGGSFPGFDYILDAFTNNNLLKNKLNWKDNYLMEVGGKQMTGAKGKMLLSMKTSDANEKAAEIRRKMQLGKERLKTAGALGAEEQTSEILVGLYGRTLANQGQAFKKSKKQLGKEDYNIIGPRTEFGRGRIEAAAAAASGFVPNFSQYGSNSTLGKIKAALEQKYGVDILSLDARTDPRGLSNLTSDKYAEELSKSLNISKYAIIDAFNQYMGIGGPTRSTGITRGSTNYLRKKFSGFASGFVPNFVSENAINALREIASGQRGGTEAEIENAREKLNKILGSSGKSTGTIGLETLISRLKEAGVHPDTLSAIQYRFKTDGMSKWPEFIKNLKEAPGYWAGYTELPNSLRDKILSNNASGFVPNFFNHLNEARNILKENGLNLDDINNQNFSQFKEVIKSKVGGTNIGEYEKALQNYLYGGSSGWSLKKPSSKSRGGYREFGSGFVPNFALPDFGANQNITLSKTQIEDALKKAKTTGNYEGLEHLIYQSLTSKIGTGKDLTPLQKNISKEEKEAYAASLNNVDKNNGAWAQWDVKKTGNKPSDKRIDNYKSYFSMDFNSLMALNKNGAELKQKLTPLTEKYGMDLSFKVPGGALSGLTHNDSLVVHYTNNQAAQEVEQTVNDFIKSKKMSLGTRAYNRGIDLINKNVGLPTKDSLGRQTPVSSYGGYLAKQITHDLASGTSLQESISKRIKNAFASGFVPNFNSKALAEAKNREMAAGYSSSEVKVGYDSRLKKSGGVGVYNKDEGSLSNAINMHLASGKDLNEIQTQGAASGFVPNFGILESALLGVFKGFADEFKKSEKFGDIIEKVSAGYNKQLESQKKAIDAESKLIASFNKLKQEFEKMPEGKEKDKKTFELFKEYKKIDPKGESKTYEKYLKVSDKASDIIKEKQGLEEKIKDRGFTASQKNDFQTKIDDLTKELDSVLAQALGKGGQQIHDKIVAAMKSKSGLEKQIEDKKRDLETLKKSPPSKKRDRDIKKTETEIDTLTQQAKAEKINIRQSREEFKQKTGVSFTEDKGALIESKAKEKAVKELGFRAEARRKESEQFGEKYTQYRQEVTEKRAKAQKIAGRVAFGAPMVLGMASSIAESAGNKDAAKAFSTLSSGASMAAQAFQLLPGPIGGAAAGLILLKTGYDAILDWQSGIEASREALEKHKNKYERTNSALSAAQQSFQNLDSLYKSGSTSLSQFVAATRQVSKTMIELASINPQLAAEMSAARTPEEKAQVQARYAQEETAKTETLEYDLKFREFKRSKQGILGDYTSGKYGAFTAESKEDVSKVEKMATQGTTLVLNEILDKMSKSESPEERGKAKEIRERVASGTATGEDIQLLMGKTKESKTFSEFGQKEAALIKLKLEEVLKNLSIPDSVRKDYLDGLAELNALKDKENAIRRLYNQELQNLLSQGTKTSYIRNKEYQRGMEDEKLGMDVGYYGKGKELDLRSLVTSEYDITKQRGEMKLEQSKREGALGIKMSKAESGERILSDLSESILGDLSGKTDLTGGGVGVNAPSEGALKEAKFWESIQNKFSGKQDILSGKMGAQDLFERIRNLAPEEASRSVLGSKEEAKAKFGIEGAQYEAMQAKLTTKMSGEDFTRKLYDETAKMRQEAAKNAAEQQKISAENVAATKGIQFKELSQALGGLSNLKKGGTRQMKREMRRAERLYKYGRTEEARGEGALGILQNVPESMRSMKNPVVREMYAAIQNAKTKQNRELLQGTLLGQAFGPGSQNEAFYSKMGAAQTYGNLRASGVGEDFYKNLGLEIPEEDKSETIKNTEALASVTLELQNFIKKIESSRLTDDKKNQYEEQLKKTAAQIADKEKSLKDMKIANVAKVEIQQMGMIEAFQGSVAGKTLEMTNPVQMLIEAIKSLKEPVGTQNENPNPANTQGGKTTEGGTSSTQTNNEQSSTASINEGKPTINVASTVILPPEAFGPLNQSLQEIKSAISAGQNRPISVSQAYV